MAVDASETESPAWWLQRLAAQLRSEQKRFNKLDDYYAGNHPMHMGGHDDRARAYREFQKRARTNYVAMVADAVHERLKVQGFRTGTGGSNTVDNGAWRLWQANGMDAAQSLVHQSAVKMSRAYVIVGPERPDAPGVPQISVEDPRSVTYEPDPTNWLSPLAAIKVWRDTVAGFDRAAIYLPDRTVYLKGPLQKDGVWRFDPRRWDFDVTDDQPDGEVPNDTGRVPVVPFLNRPYLTEDRIEALGEFEHVTDIQDRINTVILDRLVISKAQAYRQRWVAGMKIQRDQSGQPVRPFDPDVTALWVAENPSVKFGDFAQSDIAPIIAAAQEDITELAAITRTPPHYLLGQMTNISGDALQAADAGLASKLEDRMKWFGYSWDEVVRLACHYADVGYGTDATVIWRSPQSGTLLQRVQAAVQAAGAGVPWRARMEMIGYSPAEIDRLEQDRVDDALHEDLMIPTPGEVRETETSRVTGDPFGSVPTAAPSPPGTKPAQPGQTVPTTTRTSTTNPPPTPPPAPKP